MRFELVTANVMAATAPPVRYNGQRERMERYPAAIQKAFPDADVFVFQESIIPAQHKVLTAGMTDRYPFRTEPIRGTGRQLVDGGVIIFSRHPIVAQHQEPFGGPCDSTDCMCAKGFSYAKIDNCGQMFHVIGTHLQAWPNAKSDDVRRYQCGQIRKFVDRLKLGPDEPVLFGGDLNVDRHSNKRHLDDLMQVMGAQLADVHERSHPFTADPETNALVGNDESTAYASEEYPDGCYDEYMSTMRCPCAPQEWLDYAGYFTRGLAPSRATMRVHKLKSDPFTARMNLKTVRTIRDLSDHYPVCATFEFGGLTPLRTAAFVPMPDNESMSSKTILYGGILLAVIVVAILVLLGAALAE